MGNRTNYGTGRMTVDNRQKNERSRSGNPYSSHVKAGKHAGTVYNFKRKSRIRKSLTRLPILLEFIHKYIFLNFVSFYNGLNSNFFIVYEPQRPAVLPILQVQPSLLRLQAPRWSGSHRLLLWNLLWRSLFPLRVLRLPVHLL